MMTFPSAHPHHVRHLPQGHCELAKVTLLRTARLNSTNWLSNPPKSSTHASGAWRHSHPQVLSGIFYFNICERFRRCPWCNCYRRRKWTRRHEFTSWTRLIAFHIALIPLGKVWIQLFSLQLWVNTRTD